MGIEERSPEAIADASSRNKTGMALVITGFCIIILAITADAEGPIKLCNCWSALTSPMFIINTAGHVASSVLIFLGGKKMDW